MPVALPRLLVTVLVLLLLFFDNVARRECFVADCPKCSHGCWVSFFCVFISFYGTKHSQWTGEQRRWTNVNDKQIKKEHSGIVCLSWLNRSQRKTQGLGSKWSKSFLDVNFISWLDGEMCVCPIHSSRSFQSLTSVVAVVVATVSRMLEIVERSLADCPNWSRRTVR